MLTEFLFTASDHTSVEIEFVMQEHNLQPCVLHYCVTENVNMNAVAH